jgi:hypothetical protein
VTQYPRGAANVGVRQNLDAYEEACHFAQLLQEQLELLAQWEQSGQRPTDGLGMLTMPLASVTGREVRYAQLPLAVVPVEYVADVMRVLSLLIDVYRHQQRQTLTALAAATAALQQEHVHDRDVDQTAVPVEAGGAADRPAA